ncbi:MAG: type II toxin-antitoxin system RelE/ParE family toxin [Magnetococcales bacterium]|nr:type II toxin-antitoxin system RelE/ParE family toxin [Magnetococcales bacterium]
MAKTYQRARAKRDIVEHFVYLADNAGLDVAEHFLTNLRASLDELASNSKIGSLLALPNPKFVGMRKWPVKGFSNILIFYMPRCDGVSVVRVLHAARDWWDLVG